MREGRVRDTEGETEKERKMASMPFLSGFGLDSLCWSSVSQVHLSCQDTYYLEYVPFVNYLKSPSQENTQISWAIFVEVT